MRILYYSVHQILEYDEISLLAGLGHSVFPLGAYFGGGEGGPFRPPIPVDLGIDGLTDRFAELGGRWHGGDVIPRAFVELFDVVIVMHDLDFIDRHWDALSAVPIIWRSIGQRKEALEPRLAALRSKGVRVVRYAPTESTALDYAGHDALIRFGKREIDLARWTGGERRILTFAIDFERRYPTEYGFYRTAVDGLPCALGGSGNEGLPGAVGLVDFDEQRALLARSAAYFYASGSVIPYTLNFMEAWLAGIPVVALNCAAIHPDNHALAEVPRLLNHGRTGFVVSTPEDARATLQRLLDDPALGRRIGRAGAAAARRLFHADVVGPHWQALFGRLGLIEQASPSRISRLFGWLR